MVVILIRLSSSEESNRQIVRVKGDVFLCRRNDLRMNGKPMEGWLRAAGGTHEKATIQQELKNIREEQKKLREEEDPKKECINQTKHGEFYSSRSIFVTFSIKSRQRQTPCFREI
jgi:hypothetical protein